MDAAIKGRWVKALRSCEYKQVQGVLHDGVGFCCLGVLCDVEIDGDWRFMESDGIVKDCWAIVKKDHMEDMDYEGVSDLTSAFKDKCGLEDYNEGTMIDMNDEGISFDEIADWIEDNL